MSTLTVTSSQNYGGRLLLSINSLVFSAAAGTGAIDASFDSDQFGPQFLAPHFYLNGISTALAITGDANQDIIAGSVAGAFSAAAWTFTNWSSPDLIELSGTSGNDTITGSSQADYIFAGGGGVDILSGGGGNDVFADLALHPFGSIDGGAGDDDIIVVDDGLTY